MQQRRTVLIVSSDCAEHAKRFGAIRTSTGIWYAEEPLSFELQNYVPRPRNQPLYENPPPCQICGADTRKLPNRQGQPFWRCRRPSCPGTVDYLDYLEATAPTRTLGHFLPVTIDSLLLQDDPVDQTDEKTPHPLRHRWQQIVAEAATTLGSPMRVLRWLEQPKVAFGNLAPIRLLDTDEGCDAVIKLLREVWD